MKTFRILLLIGFATLIMLSCDTTNHNEHRDAQINSADSVAKQPYEAISLLGDTLYATKFPKNQQQKYDSALKIAQHAYSQQPNSLYHIVQLGKSLTDLQHFQQAIDIYTEGIHVLPDEAVLYLQRGNCYIITRQLDKAVKDLKKSITLAKNTPYNMTTESKPTTQYTSNLSFTAHYQLGIAYYLTGKYGKAAQQYEVCLKNAQSEQESAVVADWLYMTYRRLGEDEIAEKTLDVINNELHRYDQAGYFERIMMYKGMIEPEELLQMTDSTQKAIPDQFIAAHMYGIGNYYLSNGDDEKGLELFNTLLHTQYWVGWSYIAAEADLARMRHQHE